MKKKFIRLSVLAAVMLMIGSVNLYAGAWEDILKNSSSDKEITGKMQTANIYNAVATFTIKDGDGFKNNFATKDYINAEIKGNGVNLSTNGFLSKDQFIEWAKVNNEQLLKAVFGNSPEVSFTGNTNTQNVVKELYTNVSATPDHSSAKTSKMPFAPVTTKDIVAGGYYDFMKIGENKDKATGTGGVLGYEHRFGENKAHSLGFALPYRMMNVDDNLDSKAQILTLMPFYKHRWYGDNSLTEAMVNLTVGATYLKSTMFPDGGGYIEYGGGAGVKYSYLVTPLVNVNAGLSYQVSKKNIPSSLVPDELTWLSEAMNNLPMEQDITPSVGVVYHLLPDTLLFRGELFRISQLQSNASSDLKNQTVALGIFTYKIPGRLKASIGYKQSFEVKNLTDKSIIASVGFGW